MIPSAEYGFWLLAAVNAALFIGFAYSFARPLEARDWRSFGAFSAFIVALFAEMYGFPLTIYLLAGWLQTRWPGVNWFSHDSGHLLEMIAGPGVNPHFGPFHLISTALILLGFWLIAAAWPVLYRAARSGRLATAGPYARIRHPQYAGFILITTGFLLQWPTLITLAMYPVLVVMYLRLAAREDASAAERFGAEHAAWARSVPAWIPTWRRAASGPAASR
ncbi:isoprenylcysteine carboxylmethyltransferase family protein [Roseomonas eburnea]|uniref:Isoprenylcysteine carboxylmethyltransferase family protein n=1 Tax=Neoroseomonas eburnea TaxID=1346889 RepID=A0A9X9XGS6_9PROT|nr:isoprenylcysteine carboxylmethyltransferase family protein [Neoroseomonas eburnea]MBR0682912.1 isoprenylcysteine carboxylmethyltransferase family protein [Neoroseomonas eburnea]